MMKKLKNIALYFIAGVFILIVTVCIPFNLTISPKREFKVLDGNDEPIKDALARQICYQYSLNYRKQVEMRSDIHGKIDFPKVVVNTDLFSLITAAVLRVIEFKIDANIGSSDTIGVFVEGHDWKWFYDGNGLESGVIRFEMENGGMGNGVAPS